MNILAVIPNQVITKAYVDPFLQEKERIRRNLGSDLHNESTDLVKIDQDKNFDDIKFIYLESVSVNRNPK